MKKLLLVTTLSFGLISISTKPIDLGPVTKAIDLLKEIKKDLDELPALVSSLSDSIKQTKDLVMTIKGKKAQIQKKNITAIIEVIKQLEQVTNQLTTEMSKITTFVTRISNTTIKPIKPEINTKIQNIMNNTKDIVATLKEIMGALATTLPTVLEKKP